MGFHCPMSLVELDWINWRSDSEAEFEDKCLVDGAVPVPPPHLNVVRWDSLAPRRSSCTARSKGWLKLCSPGTTVGDEGGEPC